MRLVLLAAAVLLVAVTTAGAQSSSTPARLTTPPVSGGLVRAIAISGSTAYIGGDFHYVGGVLTGHYAALTTSGSPRVGWPYVNGDVYASVPDGAGGWYIGGFFDRVGATTREGLAHILSGGSVDKSWNIAGSVNPIALAIAADKLFVATSGDGLRAFDLHTGAQASIASNTADDEIDALAVYGNTVYAGGRFSAVDGGKVRGNLAAFNATTGAVTTWNPAVTGGEFAGVTALAVHGSTLYVGGSFAKIGSATRTNLASFDLATGKLTSWAPSISTGSGSAEVDSFAFSGSNVFVGGGFGQANGVARFCLAAFDATTGHLDQNWMPGVEISDVTTLAVSGTRLYAGSGDISYSTANDGTVTADPTIAALDTTSGATTSFAPTVGGAIETIAASGSSVFVGGQFTSVGGSFRLGLAAVDLTTGNVKPWTPQFPASEVDALATSGSTLYVGGSFEDDEPGVTLKNLAAFRLSTGALVGWTPWTDGSVEALAISGSTVFVGGDFTTVNATVPRANLAAFDSSTGADTGWHPNPDGGVRALTVLGSTVYAGGSFTHVGGSTSRAHLAAFNKTTGAARAWDPSIAYTPFPNAAGISALTVSATSIYAAGNFDQVNSGVSRHGAAAFDPTSAAASEFHPAVKQGTEAIAISGTSVVLAGCAGIQQVDATTGSKLWSSSALDTGCVQTLAASSTAIVVGGDFEMIGNTPVGGLAAFTP